MQSFIVVAFLTIVCGLVSAGPNDANSSIMETLKDVPENTREQIAIRLTNMSDTIEHKWEIVHDIMEGDFDDYEPIVEEELGIDASGCDRKLRKHYEDRCDEVYEKVNDEAQQIEDEREKTQAVCCALEDFEKCSLRAYDQANCVTDKPAIKENLKAARLFLSVIANITCSQFRGQCAYYASTATGFASSIAVVFASVFQLAFIFSM